ncbi:hypothetical protein OS493_002425 [Desmophyllum pertusum]|uniref:Uncharacterized protein n=1 Tax=Desmophyllum pertusum TaxID=174260 RepID=A0A9W9YT14_9CNID|nr:hypothetical protein OS493_002425 [Desmophyllum pertusum]
MIPRKDSFLQRIVIDENAMRHIDLTSTDLQLVTLRPKQSKEHQTASMENIVSNHQQGSSIGKRPTIDPKKPIPRKILPMVTNTLLSWIYKAGNFLYDVIIYLFAWTELPKDLNQNCFNWRSVTMSTADSPCPGYGCTHPGFYSPAMTDSTSSPGSARRSKPVIPEVTPKIRPAKGNMSPGSQQKESKKNHESSEEMYHTPFLMLIKHWDWLPEHITSMKDGKTIPANPRPISQTVIAALRFPLRAKRTQRNLTRCLAA